MEEGHGPMPSFVSRLPVTLRAGEGSDFVDELGMEAGWVEGGRLAQGIAMTS